MQRRDVLARVGVAAASVAGCPGGSPAGGGTNGSATVARGGTTGRPTDTAASVSLDALQPGVVTMTSPDSVGVERGGQYLSLDVSVDADAVPARDDFAFRFDGSAYRPLDPQEPAVPGVQRERGLRDRHGRRVAALSAPGNRRRSGGPTGVERRRVAARRRTPPPAGTRPAAALRHPLAPRDRPGRRGADARGHRLQRGDSPRAVRRRAEPPGADDRVRARVGHLRPGAGG